MVSAAATIDDPLVVSIPLTARFRGIRVREAALWLGPAGWCEFAPFDDYDDAAAVPWLRAAQEFSSEPAPVAVRDRIPVNCTVPSVGAAEAAAIVTAGHGCTTAKVKVAEPGCSLDDDVARVAAVRDALGPHGHLRIDANGGWSVAQARVALAELEAFDLEYVEQPCRTVEELAQVRSLGLALVAADESIRLATDPLRVVRAGGCDLAVLKVAPLGGVRSALRIAEEVGIPVVVSSAVDTSIGLSAGVAVAACLPALPYACGLGTRDLLTADVVSEAASLAPSDGFVHVARPDVDEAAVAVVAADGTRQSWWRDRLSRVRDLAGAARA
jgi:O-succinylbenzoate synthase